MHEFESVKNFVDELLKKIPEGAKVRSVSLRRGGTFTEEAVRQAFAVHAKGTLLENAALRIERTRQSVICSCGYRTAVYVDEQDGYPFLCPRCNDLFEVDPGPDLELLDVVLDSSTAGVSAGRFP